MNDNIPVFESHINTMNSGILYTPLKQEEYNNLLENLKRLYIVDGFSPVNNENKDDIVYKDKHLCITLGSIYFYANVPNISILSTRYRICLVFYLENDNNLELIEEHEKDFCTIGPMSLAVWMYEPMEKRWSIMISEIIECYKESNKSSCEHEAIVSDDRGFFLRTSPRFFSLEIIDDMYTFISKQVTIRVSKNKEALSRYGITYLNF